MGPLFCAGLFQIRLGLGSPSCGLVQYKKRVFPYMKINPGPRLLFPFFLGLLNQCGGQTRMAYLILPNRTQEFFEGRIVTVHHQQRCFQ